MVRRGCTRSRRPDARTRGSVCVPERHAAPTGGNLGQNMLLGAATGAMSAAVRWSLQPTNPVSQKSADELKSIPTEEKRAPPGYEEATPNGNGEGHPNPFKQPVQSDKWQQDNLAAAPNGSQKPDAPTAKLELTVNSKGPTIAAEVSAGPFTVGPGLDEKGFVVSANGVPVSVSDVVDYVTSPRPVPSSPSSVWVFPPQPPYQPSFTLSYPDPPDLKLQCNICQ